MYSSMDCFVHGAQIGESFGMVLAEAMLCGCPVVTASRPHKDNSQVEVVGHRRGGVVAASLANLDDALHTFRYDTRLRAELEPNPRDWVLSRFAADHVAALALRIGQHALGAESRMSLIRRLADNRELISEVPDSEIHGLLCDTLGKPRASELIAMRLVHRRSAQRVIQFFLMHWVHRAQRK
jgi:hypothetical protein